ncbi:MAG TPA: aspartate aminotransferase family protein [Candidatus Paceibacterota bacterium]|nr:aspartate aminotransferase family protein [Verrucomicrobiota bacterium]HRZ44934.1 aspartate aminotransferase family protein [Candidatus Paceibacterota bacterium]HRZ93952.1 aspartate aminotransferase family protein [Candidatus Paceibacterota bacterium]
MKTHEPLAETGAGPDPAQSIRNLFQEYVIPSYGRFDLVFTRGAGSYLWDVHGRRYLDLGSGIAVCCLGHSHPAIVETLARQASRLIHVSNLYYHELQGRLAEALVHRIEPGKCFFANSGAEANEGLFKLARRFGHDEGRFEILTAIQSFHGRTLAGIAATGQDKVKKGFEPMTPGFRHVPFNDLEAVRAALSPATVAVMIEGVQGEGGITPAAPEYLLGLRRLCDEHRLLLLMDGVQCGHYRTGRFQSFQRILETVDGGNGFCPDGISMAKSLAGGFPMGAFWVRKPHADRLGPGTHASTFGGTPLACSVALTVLEVIQREKLDERARQTGAWLREQLEGLRQKHVGLIRAVRGLGLMVGIELEPGAPAFVRAAKPAAAVVVQALQREGVLTIPAGSQVVRLLPPLNLQASEAQEGIERIDKVLSQLHS